MSASQTSLDDSLSPASTATVFDYEEPMTKPGFKLDTQHLTVPPRPSHHRRTSSSSSTWISVSVKSPKSRRKVVALSVVVFICTSLLAFASFAGSHGRYETIINFSQPVGEQQIINKNKSDSDDAIHIHEVHPPVSEPVVEEPKMDMLDPLRVLNGQPTTSFRDNLKKDLRYVTTFISAGWTNDVMTYVNLVYLALITDRIPVLPMFTPSHIGGDVPPIPFGDVFDVPRLREALGKPVVEWRDVKNEESEFIDEIGCWNTWEAVQSRENHPRWSAVPTHLNLDVSYTQAPDSIKLIPNFEHDQHTTFWALASLAYPEGRNANLRTPLPSPLKQVSLPPDEQLLCFDYMYYVAAFQPFEWELEYSPAWRYVGQYLRWAQPLEDLAEFYVRTAMGIQSEDEPTPPYVSIHMRHGDFGNYCGELPRDECFASIPTIARRVREVQDELWKNHKVVAKQVIMLSDERDEGWWDQVKRQGWLTIDHTHTVELYGDWYPVLIDAVIQSGGHGFVGTDRSTMSILAARRVKSWRSGATRMLKWGTPNADAH